MREVSEVILIIDMVKGFFIEGYPLYCGPQARQIIPYVEQLLKDHPEWIRLYLCDNHAPDDAEFKMFPPHCIAGSVETEIIDELKPYPGTIIPKTRFSALYKTDLEEKLLKLKPQRIIVVGVCTDICVMHTVSDLRDRGYKVWVPAKGVATFDREAHEFALKHMRTILGAEVS